MQAAVITLYRASNYDTRLQAFATQEKLRQYFGDVVFIDYCRQGTYGLSLVETSAKEEAR